jgi:peptide-methionine (S)-S-oxide reductase
LSVPCNDKDQEERQRATCQTNAPECRCIDLALAQGDATKNGIRRESDKSCGSSNGSGSAIRFHASQAFRSFDPTNARVRTIDHGRAGRKSAFGAATSPRWNYSTASVRFQPKADETNRAPNRTFYVMYRTKALLALVLVAACQPRSSTATDLNPSGGALGGTSMVKIGTDPGHAGDGTPLVAGAGHELAAFAEGCFWGSEDTFRNAPGVVATAVGYTGGHTAHPTYEDVCSHTTGHAEAVLVEFDPAKVSYQELLLTFWESHNPTTKNRQGPDVGDQYRSAIFTFSAEQERIARTSMLEEQKQHTSKITTEIRPIGAFYKAEDHHQQYDEKTGRRSCPLPRRAKGA